MGLDRGAFFSLAFIDTGPNQDDYKSNTGPEASVESQRLDGTELSTHHHR